MPTSDRGHPSGDELVPSRLRRPRLDVTTGLTLRAAVPAFVALLGVGAVATAAGQAPVPLFNGVSGLLRAVEANGTLRWLGAGSLVEALVPAVAAIVYGAMVPLVAARYLEGEVHRRHGAVVAVRQWRQLVALGLVRALGFGAVVVAVHALSQGIDGAAAYATGSAIALAVSMITWLAEPAMVLEQLDPVAALRRSRELFSRRVVHGAAAFLVAGTFAVASGVVLGLPLLWAAGAVQDSVPLLANLMAVTAAGLPVPLTSLLLSGAGTLLYLDRRVEAAELGRAQLSREVARVTGQDATT